MKTNSQSSIDYTKQLIAEYNHIIEVDKLVLDILLFASNQDNNNEENKLHSTI